MKKTLIRLRYFIVTNYAYILSFLIPPVILFLSYIVFGVYPFGERSVLSLDLNAQYVYYFDYMHDVFTGDESLFYSWSRNLSGEFAGIIGYYLASPFNLLVWMLPRKFITEGLLIMMLAKAGASGLAMCFLLKKGRGYSNTTTVAFSCMHALCGFFVVQTMNPMWLDGLVALPLVVWGVERICSKRRFKLYIFSLVYVFVANFYIGYMVGIFSALYFLYYLASGKGAKDTWEYFGATIMYGASSVTAILMSGFMILPVYKSLANGKFEFSTPDYTPVENFNIADIFIKLFPSTYDTVRMEGLPILYCGTLALVFAVVYFMSRNISVRERISGGILLGILVLCMYVRPADMMWHGGQMPNWLPYRYSFMVSFLLILFGAQVFDRLEKVRAKTIGTAFFVLLGVLLLCDKQAGNEWYDMTLIILIPLVVLVLMCIFAYRLKETKYKKTFSVILTVLVCGELFMNTAMSLFDMHEDIVFSDRSTYRGDIPFTRKITEQIHELDDSFYRMEKTFHRCVNDPIALRMYGMSHSSSTLNAKSIKLLDTLGFSSREHYTRYDGATMFTDDVFGVKYVLSKYKCYVPYNDTVDIENEIGVTVYENNDSLGIAYLAHKDIVGFSYAESSPFIAQNKLAAMLSGNKAMTMFRPIDELEFDSENITAGTTTDGHYSYTRRRDGEEAWVSYNITLPENGAVYMFLPTDYEREVYLYVNDQYLSNYFQYENHSIEYLGTYEEGETFNLRLKLLDDSDKLYYKSAQFYYIDPESLARFQEIMGGWNAETEVIRNSGHHLTINVNAAEDTALFTTIPYEEGWTAYVDGVQTELSSALSESLITLELEEGQHTIELKFFPAGLKSGIILTVSGMALLVIMILVSMEIKRRDSLRQTEKAERQGDGAEEPTE